MPSAEAATPIDDGVDISQLRFRYAIEGDNPPWRPVSAFDDGSKVYIEMPSGIAQGEAPPLFVIGPEGDGQLVNYRVRQNYYIVDRLFAAAELRHGRRASADRPHQPHRREAAVSMEPEPDIRPERDNEPEPAASMRLRAERPRVTQALPQSAGGRRGDRVDRDLRRGALGPAEQPVAHNRTGRALQHRSSQCRRWPDRPSARLCRRAPPGPAARTGAARRSRSADA